MSSTNLSFYSVGNRGTVRTTENYNLEEAVEILFRGMDGLGTDEDAIINVVATHTFHQRQELKKLYRQKYGKDLVKELDSELSFSFSKTVLSLMKRPEEFIIECIHQAISKSRAARLIKQLQKIYRKGLGSDEYSLIALLCPRSNDELDAIKILYKKRYGREMEDDIGLDLGEDLRSLFLDMISGERECEPEVDLDKVLDDADNLYGASLVPVGEICGTKERVLQQIFNTRSYEHLRKMIPAYEQTSNSSIEEYIDSSELSMDLKEAYQAIIKLLRNEPNFYAERLKESIKGIGTDDDQLISIIVLRSEIDLRDVMAIYHNKYGVTLQDDVIGDTSGDYRHILLKLLDLPEEDGDETHVRKQSSAGGDADVNVEEEEEEDEVTITQAADDEVVAADLEGAEPVVDEGVGEEEEMNEQVVEVVEEVVVEEEVVKEEEVVEEKVEESEKVVTEAESTEEEMVVAEQAEEEVEATEEEVVVAVQVEEEVEAPAELKHESENGGEDANEETVEPTEENSVAVEIEEKKMEDNDDGSIDTEKIIADSVDGGVSGG